MSGTFRSSDPVNLRALPQWLEDEGVGGGEERGRIMADLHRIADVIEDPTVPTLPYWRIL